MNHKLNITGMTCGHCQASVQKALEGVPGVTKAEVNLSTGTAVVEGEADVSLLVTAVEQEGYGVSRAQ